MQDVGSIFRRQMVLFLQSHEFISGLTKMDRLLVQKFF